MGSMTSRKVMKKSFILKGLSYLSLAIVVQYTVAKTSGFSKIQQTKHYL
jgi:hypothetical protein